jgi:hypothetical protein
MPDGDLQRVVTGERWVTGEAVVRHGAERVDVGGGRYLLAGRLLRRHVPGGPDDRVGVGEAGVGRCRPGNPEVDQDHRPVGLQQQVAGLDIAVHDPRRVRGLQRVRRPRDDG